MKSLSGTVFAFCLLSMICYCIDFGDATMCKPLSQFKIDCNTCWCSKSGRQYTCSQKICSRPDLSDFFAESNENGYVLLRPKEKVKWNDDDYVLTKKGGRSKIKSGDENESFELDSGE